MRLALDQDSNVHLIRNYGPGYVTVDAEQRLTRSFALAPDALLPGLGSGRVSRLWQRSTSRRCWR